MPQRVTARPQEFLEIRSKYAGLNARGARYVVDFEDLVQLIEIDRHRGITFLRHVDAPHDRRAAARRDDDVTIAVAPRERCFELGVIGRVSHDVGWVRVLEIERVGSVREVRAVGVEGAVPGVIGAEGSKGGRDGTRGARSRTSLARGKGCGVMARPARSESVAANSLRSASLGSSDYVPPRRTARDASTIMMTSSRHHDARAPGSCQLHRGPPGSILPKLNRNQVRCTPCGEPACGTCSSGVVAS